MKRHNDENIQGLQRLILFLETLTSFTHFGF